MATTPGPWAKFKQGGILYITGPKPKGFKEARYYIATVEKNLDGENNAEKIEEAEANAATIAAAPELLEALKAMTCFCFTDDETMLSLMATSRGGHISEALELRVNRIGKAFDAARAAIAAAEGNPTDQHTGEPDPTDLARDFNDAIMDAEQPKISTRDRPDQTLKKHYPFTQIIHL